MLYLTRRSAAVLLAAAFTVPARAWSQGAPRSSITETDVAALKPGEFIWAPHLAPEGPMVLVVSLAAQQAYVYRNGLRIGASTVSTGCRPFKRPPSCEPISRTHPASSASPATAATAASEV